MKPTHPNPINHPAAGCQHQCEPWDPTPCRYQQPLLLVPTRCWRPRQDYKHELLSKSFELESHRSTNKHQHHEPKTAVPSSCASLRTAAAFAPGTVPLAMSSSVSISFGSCPYSWWLQHVLVHTPENNSSSEQAQACHRQPQQHVRTGVSAPAGSTLILQHVRSKYAYTTAMKNSQPSMLCMHCVDQQRHSTQKARSDAVHKSAQASASTAPLLLMCTR